MFDIAVIGGGLAGCSAAITLAMREHSVLLLEAGSYPRAKVCGEFLSPECAAILDDISFLPSLHALKPALIHRVRITAPNQTEWQSDLPEPALGVSRYALDFMLFEYARSRNVQAEENARVIEIQGNLDAGFTLSVRTNRGMQSFKARAVICAYGKHSNLDRSLRKSSSNQNHNYVALKRHFDGPSLYDQIDLHVFQGGYCGMSHIEDGTVNVCLLVRQREFQNAVKSNSNGVDGFISWMCKQNPALGSWLGQANPIEDNWLSIAHIPLTTRSAVEQDILFTGDAAAMVAPLAGDGMAMALQSGKLAAQSIDAFLHHEFSATHLKQAYTQTWNKTFRSRLRTGRLLQSIMLRPTVLGLGLKLINQIPAVGNFLIQQTRDLSLLEQEQ